ncbi:hypothetical protein [Pseudomonas sp. zfem005]|uniref:hypothetical protein n=1 Tax=Pseudomonas sp. zfem005 TaxID=3078200 RepID=UPI002927F3D4|nr:hypothetical protein [Pseudomonas sp. zfem005]MDU9414202.1 hypothetical protein [Pseudomonas sp. zfem005]
MPGPLKYARTRRQEAHALTEEQIDATLSVIPGTATPVRPAQYMAQLQAEVPRAFWLALREEGLVGADVPLPV